MDTVTELIDSFLRETRHQSLIDASRVHDFLLDLRLALTVPDTAPEDLAPEPV